MQKRHNIAKVPSLINASGTLTELGGCRMFPQVGDAMKSIGQIFVDLNDYQRLAGKEIAGWLGVDSAMITCGAAAGLIQVTAACIAGNNKHLRQLLPDVSSHNQVIVMRSHRNPYDQALRVAGAAIIEIGNAIETHPWELENAINLETAAVVFFLQSEMLDASLRLQEVLNISHRAGVPVIVDAAAELPPKKNLWELARKGADAVVFSGGKDIRGPQTSGLVLGKKEIIEAALFHSAPNDGVGRPMKASKEIIAGLLTAVELYLEEDENARIEKWHSLVDHMKNELQILDSIQVQLYFPNQPRVQPPGIPRLMLTPKAGHPIAMAEIVENLRSGTPPVVVDSNRESIILNPQTLTDEEADVVVKRIISTIMDQ